MNSTGGQNQNRSEVKADTLALALSVFQGKPPDPEVLRRVRERADKARSDLSSTRGEDMGVQLIREIRGALPDS